MKTEVVLDVQHARAKREWNEAWSGIAASRRTWQVTGIVQSFAIMALAVGLVYVARLPKQVPYVVSVDKIGNTAYAGSPDAMSAEVFEKVKLQSIRRFVELWRTVTSDESAQRRNYEKAWAHIGRKSQADAFLNIWYQQNDPLIRAASGETVTYANKTYDTEGTNTFGIWFTETVSRGAAQSTTKTYRARITYTTQALSDEAARDENPFGILITELTVEEVK